MDPAGSAAPKLAPVGVPADGRRFRIVTVASVRVELPDQYPTVTLAEVEVERRQLAFRIGVAEGVALAHALGGTEAPRPLTHDLFALTLQRFSIEVAAVRVVGRRATTYVAQVDLVGPHGREVLGCRPSDGLVLALRQRVPAPVLVDERLLATTGDVLDGDVLDDEARDGEARDGERSAGDRNVG